MRYFIMSADDRIRGRVEPIGISEAVANEMSGEGLTHNLENINLQIPIKSQDSVEYVDWIERPIPLVSDSLKQLLTKIAPDVKVAPLVLADMKKLRQDVYWIIAPPRIDCLSLKTEFLKDGTLKRLVIDNRKASRPIFQIKGIREKYTFVNLAVAESILRRSYSGIKLRKVENEVESSGMMS
ncbi:serine protease, partial [Bacillus cereus]|nr:serine protease [Bacillus cereus]